MDLFLFPYNAMFSGAPNQNKGSDVYVVKVNGNVVPITHHFYWKKDMLEQSANHYASYRMKGNRVYLNDYLDQKKWPASVKFDLKNNLTQGVVDFHTWAGWYLSKAGYPVQDGDIVSLCRLYGEVLDQDKNFTEKQVIDQINWTK